MATPAPQPTRQQLDDLDALLQRMLALPVNSADEPAPADESLAETPLTRGQLAEHVILTVGEMNAEVVRQAVDMTGKAGQVTMTGVGYYDMTLPGNVLIGYQRRRFVIATAAAGLIWAAYSFFIGRLGGRAFEDKPWAGLLLAFGATIAVSGLIEVIRRIRSARSP